MPSTSSPIRRPSPDEALGLVAHATRDIARGLIGDMSCGILDGVLHALGELGVATAEDDERRQPQGRNDDQPLHQYSSVV
jgi:hypothetical protein